MTLRVTNRFLVSMLYPTLMGPMLSMDSDSMQANLHKSNACREDIVVSQAITDTIVVFVRCNQSPSSKLEMLVEAVKDTVRQTDSHLVSYVVVIHAGVCHTLCYTS